MEERLGKQKWVRGDHFGLAREPGPLFDRVLGRNFGPVGWAGPGPLGFFLSLGKQKKTFQSIFGPVRFGPQKPANLGPKQRALDTKIWPEFRPGPTIGQFYLAAARPESGPAHDHL